MYKKRKKVCFVTPYLEELLLKVEKEPRRIFIGQNKNKKGIKKTPICFCVFADNLFVHA